jgi:hypothetical protein
MQRQEKVDEALRRKQPEQVVLVVTRGADSRANVTGGQQGQIA